MQSSDYLRSGILKNHIDEIIELVKDEDTSDSQLRDLLSKILLNVFNDGIISNMTERKSLSNKTMLKKSKEASSYLPANFRYTDTCKELVRIVQNEVLSVSTNYILDIGYKPILDEALNKVFQIAYAVGVTTGFEIASDKDFKNIYESNVERFLKSGVPGSN